MADLKGQVALVTGASRGIGSVIAQYLGEAGVNVGVNYLASEDSASRVVESVTKAGAEAVLVPADVSQEAQAQAAVKQVVDRWGRIDILVNNAGITRDKLLLRMTVEDWDRVLDVDLRGAFLCT